jgi:hypothetical protein
MSFKVNSKAEGKLSSVKMVKKDQHSKEEYVKLQFLTDTDEGMAIFEIKIKNSSFTKEQALKMKGQIILIENLNIVKVDFNTYYNSESIPKIIK